MSRTTTAILILLAVLASGCRIAEPAPTEIEVGEQQAAAVVPTTEVAITPTDTPIPIPPTEVPPTPSPTSLPPTATLVPTPAELFRDDFDRELAEGWTWIRELPELWSLEIVPGSLRIFIQPKNCASRQHNILVREPSVLDFQIETFVDFRPLDEFQIAGLTVFMDDNNRIQLGRALCNQPYCVGNGIYFDLIETGAFQEYNFGTNLPDPSKVYLRLSKAGDTYTAYASVDNLDWKTIGVHKTNILPRSVGLIAGQSCTGSVPADFDYFSIKQLP